MFEFEIMNNSSISIRYNYGGEYFSFNLYLSGQQWILHPFEGILIANKDMCRLVISDMLQHKPFQVMLAKQHIPLSSIRTSVDLNGLEQKGATRDDQNRENPDFWVQQYSVTDLEDFILLHTIHDIIQLESASIQSRMQLYKHILQKMFTNGSGPADEDFRIIQGIVQAYELTIEKINNSDRRNNGNRRW